LFKTVKINAEKLSMPTCTHKQSNKEKNQIEIERVTFENQNIKKLIEGAGD